MVKRRSLVVGLGALATGSGAVFSSAAFASSTTATSDFRVVVEDDLVVEAGPAFRDDNDGYGNDDPSEPPYITDSDGLYENVDSDGLDGVIEDADDLPAIYVSDGTNGGLRIELAVPNRHSEDEVSLDEDSDPSPGDAFEGTFSEVLQVRNEGTEELTFGIKFADFGDMVTNSSAGDAEILTENVYGDIFAFDRTSTGQISSNSYEGTPSDPDDQSVANGGTTIAVGETVSIDLTVDLAGYTDVIRRVATPGTDSVFGGGSTDTVQLVRELQFGALNSSDAL